MRKLITYGGWAIGCLIIGVSHVRALEPDGPLDRLVSYFSHDLKSIDEEMAQLKQLTNVSPLPAQQTQHMGYSSMFSSNVNARYVTIDLGRPVNIDKIVLVPMYSVFYGWTEGHGYGFPARYRVEVASSPDFNNAELIAKDDGIDIPNPGSNPVVYTPSNTSGQYVRVWVTKPWQRKSKSGELVGAQVFALGELMVLRGNVNLAAGLPARNIEVTAAPGSGGGRDSPEDKNLKAAYLVDGHSILGPPVIGEPGTKGIMTKPIDKKDASAWIQIDLENVVAIEEIRLLPAWNPDEPRTQGYGFPSNFKVEISDYPNMEGAKLVGTYNDTVSPNSNPVTIRGNELEGRYVRLTATNLASVGKNTYALALGEMEIYSDVENFAINKPVSASSLTGEAGWNPKYLVDGTTSQGRLVPWPKWFDLLEKSKDAQEKMEQLRAERELKSKGAVETVIRTSGYVIGGLALLFVYLSFRSLLKKRRAVEELRSRIARDIHDEIGSGMGTISLLSRMAQDGDWEDAKEDLREINRLSMSMAESVRDIVWFNRTDVDTVRDLLMKMRETAESMLAKQMEINFQTLGAELVRPMNGEVRREIFLIYREALHNILKHAQAHKVEIRAGLEGGDFVLGMRDDGKGFDLTLEKSGAGMGSMKKRAESLKGALQVETSPGGGTNLVLRARLK
jgi:signal transduction histidine kinase